MARYHHNEAVSLRSLSRQWRWGLRLSVLTAGGAIVALVNQPASAVPSYADQTGMPCSACHVGGFGPELTPFGREFKIDGYTMRTKKSNPFAMMIQSSLTHTAAPNPGLLVANGGPPANFSSNNNLALDQASLFVAGGVNQHLGGFMQITYDGIGQALTWDNTDIRLVNKGQILGTDAVYGLSFNNNPTVQDAWNSTPAWGFPYTTSALANTPGAAPLIDGGLAQGVVGMTAYGWFNHHLFVEGGAYITPTQATLTRLGAGGGMGSIHGAAPYARVAYQTKIAGGTAEAGAFLLKAAIDPNWTYIPTGNTDQYTDVGLDATWYKALTGGNTLTANARYTHEVSNLQGSCVAGLIGAGGLANSNCADNTLNEWVGDVSYYWHNKVGTTLGVFATTGTTNAVVYTQPSARPDSNGLTAQVDYTPWGDGKGPMGPLVNLRVGVQYTAYGRFNGGVTNWDGNGANAADANTLRVFTWLAF